MRDEVALLLAERLIVRDAFGLARFVAIEFEVFRANDHIADSVSAWKPFG